MLKTATIYNLYDAFNWQTVCFTDAEEEYMIAADLTLYSNPLNQALNLEIRPQPKTAPAQSKDDKDENKDEDMIASDMTKYDSPMDDLDKIHDDKQKHKDVDHKTDK